MLVNEQLHSVGHTALGRIGLLCTAECGTKAHTVPWAKCGAYVAEYHQPDSSQCPSRAFLYAAKPLNRVDRKLQASEGCKGDHQR